MASSDLNCNSTVEAVNSTPSETQWDEYDFDWMTTANGTLNYTEENLQTTRLDDTTSTDSLPVLTGEEVEAFFNEISSLGLEMPEIDIDIGKYLNSELYGDDLPLLDEYLPQSRPEEQPTSDQVHPTTSELLNQQELQTSQSTVDSIPSPVEDARIPESMKTIDQREEEPPVISHETISLIKSSMLLLCENLPEDLNKATDGFEVQGDCDNPQGVESMSYIEDVGFSRRYTNPFTSCAPIDRIPPASEELTRLNFEIDKNNNETCQHEEKQPVKEQKQEDYAPQSNNLTGPCLTALPPGTTDKLALLPDSKIHSEEKSMSVPCLEQLPEGGQVCQPTLEEGWTAAEVKKYRRRSDSTSSASRRYGCDLCEARFTAPSNLKIHQRIHTNERPYACDICPATFIQSGDLKKHRRTHTNERPYACDVCEARFTASGNLKTHRRIHTNERSYACDVCEARFIQSGSLKNHRRTHTNERPYACDVCPATFIQSGSLKYHRRIHANEKPYACDVCEARFSMSCSLKKHRRIHTNERPYACDVCEARFTESGSLKYHRRTHTNERPYACDVCEARFSVSSSLKRHMRTHTK